MKMGTTLRRPEERSNKKEIATLRLKKGRVRKVYHTPRVELDIFNNFTIQPSFKLNKKIFVDLSGAEIDLGRVIIKPYGSTKCNLKTENGVKVYGQPQICPDMINNLDVSIPKLELNGNNYKKIQRYENSLRRNYYIRFDKLGKQLFYLTGSCATIGTTCRIDLLNADTMELSYEGKILLKKIDEMELCRDTVKIGQILLEFLHILKLTVLRPDFMKYERKSSFENLVRLLRELCEILIRIHYRQTEENVFKNRTSMMGGDV